MSAMRSVAGVWELDRLGLGFAMTGHKARAAHAVIDLDAALKRNEK